MTRNDQSQSKRSTSGTVPEEQEAAKRGELPESGGRAQRFPLRGKPPGAGIAEPPAPSPAPAAGSPQRRPFTGQPQSEDYFGGAAGFGRQLHPLAGRIALVTGASRGIGYATALALANAGAHVVAVARTVEGLEELNAALKGLGGSATLFPLDLMDYSGIDQLGLALQERFGRLDVLVGNAGMLGPLAPLGHVEPKAWDEVMAVNVTANWRLIRVTDPLLKLSEAGRVVFLTSGITAYPPANWGPYAVSKSALEALARIYAAETTNTRVRVNLFTPGPVRTHMRAQAIPGEDPMTVETTPDDVAEKIVEMCLPTMQEHGKLYSYPLRRLLGPGDRQSSLRGRAPQGGPRGQRQFGVRFGWPDGPEQDPQSLNRGASQRDHSAWGPPGQYRAARLQRWAALRAQGASKQGGDLSGSQGGSNVPTGGERTELAAGNPPQTSQPPASTGAEHVPLEGRPYGPAIAEPPPTSVAPEPGSPPNWQRGSSRFVPQSQGQFGGAGGAASQVRAAWRRRWAAWRAEGAGEQNQPLGWSRSGEVSTARNGEVPIGGNSNVSTGRVGDGLTAGNPPQTEPATSKSSPSGAEPRSGRKRSP